MRARSFFSPLAVLAALAGCSRSSLDLPIPRPSLEPPAPPVAGSGGSGGAGGNLVDAGPDVVDAGPEAVPEIVYVATGNELFVLDVDALALNTVGLFSGCNGSVIDIAVDRENHMFATTTMGFATVDSSNGSCSMVALGAYPNSLVTVPKGTIDPDDETLVGFVDSTYVRIDKSSGTINTVGYLLAGDMVSSGDIAVLPDGRAFLSVKQGGCADCIVQIDPETGAMLTELGPIGFPNVFGLASSKGKGVGFDSDGAAFTIDLATGLGTLLPLTGVPPNIHYNGAASLPAKDAL